MPGRSKISRSTPRKEGGMMAKGLLPPGIEPGSLVLTATSVLHYIKEVLKVSTALFLPVGHVIMLKVGREYGAKRPL